MVYLPPGWPESVRPPGAPGWEATATEFLLDCCPPDYRGYGVLRRHPVVLARFATEHLDGQRIASRSGLTRLRIDLTDRVPPPVLTSAIAVWQEQAAATERRQQAVELVERALRGTVFVRRL